MTVLPCEIHLGFMLDEINSVTCWRVYTNKDKNESNKLAPAHYSHERCDFNTASDETMKSHLGFM